MERVRKVTSWPALEWGEHLSVAACSPCLRFFRMITQEKHVFSCWNGGSMCTHSTDDVGLHFSATNCSYKMQRFRQTPGRSDPRDPRPVQVERPALRVEDRLAVLAQAISSPPSGSGGRHSTTRAVSSCPSATRGTSRDTGACGFSGVSSARPRAPATTCSQVRMCRSPTRKPAPTTRPSGVWIRTSEASIDSYMDERLMCASVQLSVCRSVYWYAREG